MSNWKGDYNMKNQKILKKSLFLISLIIGLFFLFIYAERWKFRNNEGSLGKIVNTIFNLNTLEVYSNVENSKIIWLGQNEQGEIISNEVYKNKSINKSGIKNNYGMNGFKVFVNGKVKSFIFMKKSWSQTYDYKFIISPDSVVFIKTNERTVKYFEKP
jgi:hypothetical protein